MMINLQLTLILDEGSSNLTTKPESFFSAFLIIGALGGSVVNWKQLELDFND